MPTLANTPAAAILLWVVILIAVVLLGAIGIFALRRSMFSDPSRKADDAGLMEEMRRMVQRGEMTQDEYDQARRAIIEKAKARTQKSDPS